MFRQKYLTKIIGWDRDAKSLYRRFDNLIISENIEGVKFQSQEE